MLCWVLPLLSNTQADTHNFKGCCKSTAGALGGGTTSLGSIFEVGNLVTCVVANRCARHAAQAIKPHPQPEAELRSNLCTGSLTHVLP